MLHRSIAMPEPVMREDDHRVVVYGIRWEQYEAIRAATDHVAGLRMTYLEGALEIMSPSTRHELVKKLLARLIEIYAIELDIPLTGVGSTTWRRKEMERALEPDECYVLGPWKEVPDFAIEVVVTSGGLDKLEVYRGLGVAEVWFWVDGRMALYQLAEGGYVPVERSRFLPDLDPTELTGVIAEADIHNQTAAVKRFRTRILSR